MNSEQERRSFMLGMTLNELVFNFIFILLIGTALWVGVKDDEIKRKEKELSAKQGEIEALKRQVFQISTLSHLAGLGQNATPEEINSAFSRLIEATKEETQQKAKDLEKLKNKLSDTELELAAKQREIGEAFERLELKESSRSRLAGLGPNPTSEEIDSFFSKLIEADAQNKELIEKLEKKAKISEESKLRCETQEGQIAYLEKGLENCRGGRDFKPCWVDKTGSIEYLYSVTISENSLRIKATWPERRSVEPVVNNAKKMASKDVTIDEFRELANPILELSNKEDCRHYVRIFHDADVSMLSFKKKMLTIEDYFYKWMSR